MGMILELVKVGKGRSTAGPKRPRSVGIGEHPKVAFPNLGKFVSLRLILLLSLFSFKIGL